LWSLVSSNFQIVIEINKIRRDSIWLRIQSNHFLITRAWVGSTNTGRQIGLQQRTSSCSCRHQYTSSLVTHYHTRIVDRQMQPTPYQGTQRKPVHTHRDSRLRAS